MKIIGNKTHANTNSNAYANTVNSDLLDLYEFRALLEWIDIDCSGSFLLYILSAKKFWDADGMISFETLVALVKNANVATLVDQGDRSRV